jgi:hypothetical protein
MDWHPAKANVMGFSTKEGRVSDWHLFSKLAAIKA